MRVCATHGSTESCTYVHRDHQNNYRYYLPYPGFYDVTVDSNKYYRLPPGGHVTVHFNQLVVANAIKIFKDGVLTLCEVDVLGTPVVLAPEGQSPGIVQWSVDYKVVTSLNTYRFV